MAKSKFEQNGGTYRKVGDYYIPNITVPPEEKDIRIGIWGAGVRWTPLTKSEAPTEPTGET